MHTNSPPQEAPLVAWNAPAQMHVERTRLWYIIAGSFVVASLLYSVFSGGWTFSMLIIALTGVYWKMHTVQAPVHSIELWKEGFAFDGNFTTWDQCNGYWILGFGDVHQLHIEKRNGIDVHMLTGGIDPYLLHELLPQMLPHLSDRQERVLDTIIRICKL